MVLRCAAVSRLLEQATRNPGRPRLYLLFRLHYHDHSVHPQRLGAVCRRFSRDDRNRCLPSERPRASRRLRLSPAPGRHENFCKSQLDIRASRAATKYVTGGLLITERLDPLEITPGSSASRTESGISILRSSQESGVALAVFACAGVCNCTVGELPHKAERISNRLKYGPVMVYSQDPIPLDEIYSFHDGRSFFAEAFPVISEALLMIGSQNSATWCSVRLALVAAVAPGTTAPSTCPTEYSESPPSPPRCAL